MQLNLDQILEAIGPKPLVLRIDGKDHPVRKLSIADAARFDDFEKMDDPTAKAFLSGLFEGEPPLCVQRIGAPDLIEGSEERGQNNIRCTLVYNAIAAHFLESISTKKKLGLALSLIDQQIHEQAGAAAGGNSSSV